MSRSLYQTDEELYTDEAADLHHEFVTLLRPFVTRIANNDLNLNETKIVMMNGLNEVINDTVYQRNRARRNEQLRIDPPVIRAQRGVRMATVGGAIPTPDENDARAMDNARVARADLARLDFDDLEEEMEDPD